MKVLFSEGRGKSLIHFRGELIKEMISKGHEVICTIPSPEAEMKSFAEKNGIKYYCMNEIRVKIPVSNRLGNYIKYFMLLKIVRPDVCILCTQKSLAALVRAAVRCKIKQIALIMIEPVLSFTLQKRKDKMTLFRYKKYYERIIRYCDKVFFMNQDDFHNFCKWKLVDNKKAVYAPGAGVNISFYSKKPMPITDVVCMTAAHFQNKGIREFIDAAKFVHEKYPKVKFLFVGGDNSKKSKSIEEELEQAAEEGLIYYCGYTDDVRPYLEVCTIFVLPSEYEGNGRSIAEALSLGRPVITTKAPGCRDMVINGYNGFIVPAHDTRALADKIMLLLEKKELKLKMAENSYKLCKEEFDMKIIHKIYLDQLNL